MSRRRTDSQSSYRLVLTLLLLLNVLEALSRTSVEKVQEEPSSDESWGDDGEISTLDEINLAEIPEPPPSSIEPDIMEDLSQTEAWYDEVFDVDEESHRRMIKELIQAIKRDNESLFKSFILERGIDGNASYEHPSTGRDGEIMKSTLLHWTALYGAPKCARVLIDAGVYLNAKDKRLLTPLHYSAVHGSESVAKILIESGAEVDALDMRNQTPLHKACRSGELAVVELLLKNDADANAVDTSRRTPLHLAAYQQQKEIIELLLDAGASKAAEDMYGNRPIDLACAADGVSYYYTDLSAHYDLNCIYSTPSEIEELLSP